MRPMPKNVLKLRNAIGKNSPTILTVMGIVGFVTTVVLAVQAVPVAKEELEIAEHIAGMDNTRETTDLTKMETFKAVYKCYIPAAIMGSVSIACILGAKNINTKRSTALAAAYALSEGRLHDYQEQVVSKLGEKTAKQFKENIAHKKLQESTEGTEVIVTGDGNVLCYDALSGRYFRSTKAKIIDAKNETNEKMIQDMWVCINDFYTYVGLSDIEIGRDLGWDVNSDGIIDLFITSDVSPSGIPCLVVSFEDCAKPHYA